MNRRTFLGRAAQCAGAAWLAGCSASTPSRRLVVGMELGYPPFESKDDQGHPAGVSVDLARALADFLQRELVIEDLAFDGLIVALKTGKIDLILSSMTRTEERAKSIAFSDPYLSTGLCLLVGKESPVQSAADLATPGRKVAVKKGTTGHAYALAHLPQAELLVLDKEAAAVLEVVQRKVDAFIYDQMSTYQHWQKNPDTTRALLTPFQKESWAIGLRQEDTNLLSEVNRFLASYRQSGGFEKLGDTWLREQKEAFRSRGIPFYF